MPRQLLRLIALAVLLTGCARGPARMPGPAMDPGMMDRHMAPIPPEYAGLTNPLPSDTEVVARGRDTYLASCAACHGEGGWGDGPAAAGLNPPPAPLAHTATMLSDAYLFYRISEGGCFLPFDSAMPAWKDRLSETERWEVILYLRSLSAGLMGDMMGGANPMGGMVTGMMGWLLFVWLGVALLLVVLVIAGVWALRRSARGGPPSEDPLAILKRRYASGEISAEQFEAMKAQLKEE